jgi:hypothetical protein
MGEIYLTEQDPPRREVALKLLSPELSEDASRERFARESEAAASIDHGRVREVIGSNAIAGRPLFEVDGGKVPIPIRPLRRLVALGNPAIGLTSEEPLAGCCRVGVVKEVPHETVICFPRGPFG